MIKRLISEFRLKFGNNSTKTGPLLRFLRETIKGANCELLKDLKFHNWSGINRTLVQDIQDF